MDSVFEQMFNKLGGLEVLNESIPLLQEPKYKFIESTKLVSNYEFLDFISFYGGRSFVEDVVCSEITDTPFFDRWEIPITIIFGFVEGSFGITDINGLVKDNIPKGYIAFAMGNPTGDYFLYNIESKGVYFWKHDNAEGEDVFQIASSLTSFVRKMKKKIAYQIIIE